MDRTKENSVPVDIVGDIIATIEQFFLRVKTFASNDQVAATLTLAAQVHLLGSVMSHDSPSDIALHLARAEQLMHNLQNVAREFEAARDGAKDEDEEAAAYIDVRTHDNYGDDAPSSSVHSPASVE